jgi:hypothetical protein
VLPQHQVGTTIPHQGIFLGLSKLKFYARKIFFSHAIVGSNGHKTARNFYDARLEIFKNTIGKQWTLLAEKVSASYPHMRSDGQG